MRTRDEHTNGAKRPDDSSSPYLTETVPTSVATWDYGVIGVWLLVRLGMPLLFVAAFLELDQAGDLTTLWAADVLLLVGCGLYLLDGVKEGSHWLLYRAVAWWVTRTEKQAASPAVVGEVVAADIAIIELEMDSWFWSEGHPAGGRGCQSHGQNGQGGA
jgi:hypothetical protein